MKKLLLPFLALVLLISCEKESFTDLQPKEPSFENGSATIRTPTPKIEVCHYDDENDTWHVINISQNALPAHLAHGDLISDADGDGYTAVGSCTGSMDDCDDTDPNVWRTAMVYTDADGDGYTVGYSYSVCYGTDLPPGVSLTSAGTDCDDNNPNYYPGAPGLLAPSNIRLIEKSCDGLGRNVITIGMDNIDFNQYIANFSSYLKIWANGVRVDNVNIATGTTFGPFAIIFVGPPTTGDVDLRIELAPCVTLQIDKFYTASECTN